MNYRCYILYSGKIDGFYIGATSLNSSERLEKHNTKYYGDKKYTSKTDDWVLFLEIECNSMKQAMFIEKHIKKMKSKKHIKILKIYPEIIEKLKNKYDC
ncbi:MAG: GIY-YIG nuclease family protein [Bacteroidales bacterium]|jgi:putative endonuclease|nr:GIY-YIG nuclease family protein [Bacteroidales bacterium]